MSTPEPIQQHYIQSPSELLPCSGMLNFDTLLITLCIINLALLSLFMCECFFVCKIVVLVVNCFVSLCVYTQDMYFILIVFFLDDVHFIYKYTCGILFCRSKIVLMPFLVNWNLSCGKIWNITINKEKVFLLSWTLSHILWRPSEFYSFNIRHRWPLRVYFVYQ